MEKGREYDLNSCLCEGVPFCSPTSLDALVYGYLEVVLQSPLPATNSLYNQLHSCSNLVQFCSRIRAKAFPDKKLRQ